MNQWILVICVASAAATELLPARTCEYHDTIPLDGSILINKTTVLHNNLTYGDGRWGEYEYETNQSGVLSVEIQRRGCICQVTDCIRLCCQWGHVYNSSCLPLSDNTPFRVFINVTDHNGLTTTENLANHHHYVHRFIYGAGHCEYFDSGNLMDEKSLFTNGTLLHRFKNTEKRYEHAEYCIDVDPEGATTFQICVHPDEVDTITFAVNTVCMSISIPFILITFAVYAAIPQLRNIHGKSIMFYLIGLLIGYVSVVASHTSSGLDEPYCSIFAYTSYFGFILTFFWMNVMCIDIWMAFSKPIIRFGDVQRFRYYLCYACGMPLTLLAVYWTVNKLKIENYSTPIGDGYCSFKKEGYAKLIFLYVPLGCLISVNLILYFLTMNKMRQLHRESSFARLNSNQSNPDDENRHMLNARLLIVMGVSWSLEMMTWFLSEENSYCKIVSYLCDACNSLQGLLMFMFLVMRRHVWKLICKRFSKEDSMRPPLTRQCTECIYVKRNSESSVDFVQTVEGEKKWVFMDR